MVDLARSRPGALFGIAFSGVLLGAGLGEHPSHKSLLPHRLRCSCVKNRDIPTLLSPVRTERVDVVHLRKFPWHSWKSVFRLQLLCSLSC
jgi:hypothetical protein